MRFVTVEQPWNIRDNNMVARNTSAGVLVIGTETARSHALITDNCLVGNDFWLTPGDLCGSLYTSFTFVSRLPTGLCSGPQAPGSWEVAARFSNIDLDDAQAINGDNAGRKE